MSRLFLDAYAEEDENTHPQSIWPTYSRRRHVDGEWDDYTVLYADLTDVVVRAIERDLVELTDHQCPLCEFCTHDYRGLTVHLARKHNDKSMRSEYFAKRSAAKKKPAA